MLAWDKGSVSTCAVNPIFASLRNVYFHLSQTWITFTNGLQLDYLKLCVTLYLISFPHVIYMHREITFKFQSHWGRFVQSMYSHEITSLWRFRVK